MNIVAPVSRLEEVEVLAAAGADELYCGVLPREWVDRFGIANANRRPTGNLPGYDVLEAAVEAAHRNGASLSLVMNAQQYAGSQLDAAIELAERFIGMGGDALIMSDLGLIPVLSAALPSARIHVSSVATCRNGSAARLCRDLGAKRLILPRDVTIAEACEIATEVPDIEVEAFVLNDGCVFEEGACHTLHLPNRLGGPICLDSYVYRYRQRKGGDVDAATQERIAANDAAYRKWLWYRFSCGFTTTPDGMPYGPCGLCAIPAMQAGGVQAVKIAGREGPTARKLASVRMVRQIVDAVDAGLPPDVVKACARNLRPPTDHDHCATGFMCYYPEVAASAGVESGGAGSGLKPNTAGASARRTHPTGRPFQLTPRS